MDRYTRHVGVKFHEDRSARVFPGNTIICPVAAPSQSMQVLKQIYDDLQQQPWAGKFALLPPSSYHMTLFEGVCDQVRDAEHWVRGLPLDAPLAVVDDYLSRQWQTLPEFSAPDMRFKRLEYGEFITILLEPVNETVEQKLRQARDVLAEALQIRFPGHETYRFHLSLAYGIIPINVDDRKQMDRWVERWEPVLRDALNPVELLPPALCFFEDMTHFAPSRAQARRQVTE